MRVLIVLALIGVACAETFLAPAPYAYSSYVYDEAKPSYEYSSSVQTPTYNNYAHVRSGGLFERKLIAAPLATPVVAAPVVAAAAEPIIAEAKYVEPAIAQPVLKSAPLSAELRTTVPFAATTYTLPSTKLLPITYEAKPFYRLAASAPVVLAAAPAAQIVRVENKFAGEGKSQYHSQNELGEAQYGHRETFQAHDAVQDAAGNKAGSFSYVAPDGRVLTTEYIADAAGYRVASNALPSAPVAAPAFIQPVVGTVEKQAEIGESEIVVEAKSRSRRSVSEPKARSTRAIYPSFYSSPLAYSAPLAYSNSYAYSYPSYSAYSSFYRSPSLRTYSYPSYSYPSYAYSSYPYYRSFPFRK